MANAAAKLWLTSWAGLQALPISPDGSVVFTPETTPALSVKAAYVPEPSAWILLIAAGVAYFVRRRVSEFVRV